MAGRQKIRNPAEKRGEGGGRLGGSNHLSIWMNCRCCNGRPGNGRDGDRASEFDPNELVNAVVYPEAVGLEGEDDLGDGVNNGVAA